MGWSASLSISYFCAYSPDDDNVNLMYYWLNWMCLVFAGYLCCFCLCCLYFGHLLFNFCSFALAVLCGQHLCIIQLHMAHRWVFLIVLPSFCQNTYCTNTTCRVLLSFSSVFFTCNNFICSCRERHLHIHGVFVDSARVHRGFTSSQRPKNLSCQPVSSFCCTLVCWFN